MNCLNLKVVKAEPFFVGSTDYRVISSHHAVAHFEQRQISDMNGFVSYLVECGDLDGQRQWCCDAIQCGFLAAICSALVHFSHFTHTHTHTHTQFSIIFRLIHRMMLLQFFLVM